MDEPSHLRGTLSHGGAEAEFYYPAGLTWGCTHCGRCCMDAEDWDRRVLLLDQDIARLEEVGETGFYEPVEEGRFVAVTRKEGGRCVFLGENGCRVYEGRPLLCRMYPFYVERRDELFIIEADTACPGLGQGEKRGERFFKRLLGYALSQMEP